MMLMIMAQPRSPQRSTTVAGNEDAVVTLDPAVAMAENHHRAHFQLPANTAVVNNNGQQRRRVRRWKVFPGRNRFFCDGRIVMAKQISVFYFTVTLLVGTCVLFFIFDCPYLSDQISPAIPAVAALLFVFVLFALLRTSFTDPGIIPRATPDEAADVERQIVPKQSNSPTVRPPPRTKEVMINNQPIKLKYCFTCKIFRPPRASHCSLCDNCVERFDHHCPWVGNCVGKRNYRFFYMFIVSLAFLCIYVFACIITHFILLSKTMTFVEAVKASPVSVVEMIICFFSVWSILGLAGFHTYLIMSNLTTNEDIKGSFSKRNNVSVSNPYSEGGLFRNCFAILCSPVTPSLIHSRSFVYCEETLVTSPASNNTAPVISRNPAAAQAAYPTQTHNSYAKLSYQPPPPLPQQQQYSQPVQYALAAQQQQYGNYSRMLKAEGDVYLGHRPTNGDEVMMMDRSVPEQHAGNAVGERMQTPPPPSAAYYQSSQPESAKKQHSPMMMAKHASLGDDYQYGWPKTPPPCLHHHHHHHHHHHSSGSAAPVADYHSHQQHHRQQTVSSSSSNAHQASPAPASVGHHRHHQPQPATNDYGEHHHQRYK